MAQEPTVSSSRPGYYGDELDLRSQLRPFTDNGGDESLSERIVGFIGNPEPGTERAVFSHDPRANGWFCDTFGDTWFCLRPRPDEGEQI